MSQLWPRIPRRVAEAQVDRFGTMTVAELSLEATDHHAVQVYAATGGTRIGTQALREVRATIVNHAAEFGFPESCEDGTAFDRSVAACLVDLIDVAAPEAASQEIWNFTSTILCPDVTMWRFGAGNRERWIASDLTRHMFARLWWQGFLLTEVDDAGVRRTSLLDALLESELNQLLERTRIGGNRRLVREIARQVLEARRGTVPRRALIRDVTLRVRREMSNIDFQSMSQTQLESAVAEVVSCALEALEQAAAT